jgi:hypothetical protein
MRTTFGILSLLIALAIIGVLAKKQMGALTVAPAGMPATSASATLPQQSQQIQQQVKQSVESTLQQARPMPDEK